VTAELLFVLLAVGAVVGTFVVGYNAPDWVRSFRERERPIKTVEQVNESITAEWNAEYADALADNGILAVLPGEPQPVRPFFLSSNTAFRYGDDPTPTMYTLRQIYDVQNQWLSQNERRDIGTETVRK
jgi:hypothetical protein